MPVYGGASIEVQFKELAKKPQIIVATPGRLEDMIRRNKIDFSNVRTIVLDRSRRMLDMGFQEDVDAILEYMPEEKIFISSQRRCRWKWRKSSTII